MVLIDGRPADFQGSDFVAEDCESERAVQSLGCCLMIADGEEDLLQSLHQLSAI